MALGNMLTDRQAIPDGHAQLVVIEGGDLASGRVLQERRPVGLAPSASKFHADGIKTPCSVLRARDGMLAMTGGTSSSKRGCRMPMTSLKRDPRVGTGLLTTFDANSLFSLTSADPLIKSIWRRAQIP